MKTNLKTIVISQKWEFSLANILFRFILIIAFSCESIIWMYRTSINLNMNPKHASRPTTIELFNQISLIQQQHNFPAIHTNYSPEWWKNLYNFWKQVSNKPLALRKTGACSLLSQWHSLCRPYYTLYSISISSFGKKKGNRYKHSVICKIFH